MVSQSDLGQGSETAVIGKAPHRPLSRLTQGAEVKVISAEDAEEEGPARWQA